MKEVELFTDGACVGNPGTGGYGLILRHLGRYRERAGGFRLTTNDRMELLAVIEGLRALKEPCKVVVFSDSRYVVDGMNRGWARRWKQNLWRRDKKQKNVARNWEM